jgi:hypothetical protein
MTGLRHEAGISRIALKRTFRKICCNTWLASGIVDGNVVAMPLSSNVLADGKITHTKPESQSARSEAAYTAQPIQKVQLLPAQHHRSCLPGA